MKLYIDSILSNAGQVVSSSFQVRFGQEDNYGAASCTASDGFTFDNKEVIEAFGYHPTK